VGALSGDVFYSPNSKRTVVPLDEVTTNPIRRSADGITTGPSVHQPTSKLDGIRPLGVGSHFITRIPYQLLLHYFALFSTLTYNRHRNHTLVLSWLVGKWTSGFDLTDNFATTTCLGPYAAASVPQPLCRSLCTAASAAASVLCAAASVPQLTIVIGCRSLVVILPISCLYTISFAHFTAL